MELDYVRCDKCGNDKDFDVIVRYQRRKFDPSLDSSSYGRFDSNYWPDKISDDTVITCRECKRSLTYKAARECYDLDAEKMGQSLLLPSDPLPIITVKPNRGGYATTKVFVPSEFAYHIQIFGGISDRAVNSGYSVCFGNLGNPEVMTARQAAVYYRDGDYRNGGEFEISSGPNMSIHYLTGDDNEGARISYADFISPKISPEQIKRVSDAIYNKINMEFNPDIGNLDFVSGGLSSSYDPLAVHSAESRCYAFQFLYNSKYIETAFRFATEYLKHQDIGINFRQTIPDRWRGSLYLDYNCMPFLAYSGYRPLKKMPSSFQGLDVYYNSEGSLEYGVKLNGVPRAAFTNNGFTHYYRENFKAQ